VCCISIEEPHSKAGIDQGPATVKSPSGGW
jgi:hypothetical protein